MKANFETGLKICARCKRELPISEFGVDNSTLDKLNVYCKECYTKRRKEYYKSEKGRFIVLNSNQKYDKSEKGKIVRKKIYEKRRDEGLCYKTELKAKRSGSNYGISLYVRDRVRKALKNNWKAGHTLDLLGCTIEELKVHLESQFEEGMSWENFGGRTGWQIDHIVPCSYFDLSKEENQRICFNFRNLQPLWAKDNYSKGDKVPENVEELVQFLKEEIEV